MLNQTKIVRNLGANYIYMALGAISAEALGDWLFPIIDVEHPAAHMRALIIEALIGAVVGLCLYRLVVHACRSG